MMRALRRGVDLHKQMTRGWRRGFEVTFTGQVEQKLGSPDVEKMRREKVRLPSLRSQD